MASGRVQITFDCADPAALATFWAAVLGYPAPDIEGFRAWLRAEGTPDADLDTWCRIEDPTGARPRLFFQRVPEGKSVKNRVHLDVAAAPERGDGYREKVDAEVERVVGLGGHKVRLVSDATDYFVVMQDPEGNEFCID